MPDWSYHGIFKPVLSALPPLVAREFIHRGMNTIASLPFGLGAHIINFLGREESSPLLHKEIQQIDFKNPVGLSGKIDPMLSGTRAFSNLGFGFLEIGPVTWKPRESRQQPIKDNKAKRIDFPEVQPSVGLEKTIHKLRKLSKKQPIFLRLSGSSQEVERMMAELEPYADGYIVENMDAEFRRYTNKPIWIVTSSMTELSPVKLSSFDGVVLEEKTGDFELAKAVQHLRQSGFEKTIVTSGGISEPWQAHELMRAGADLVLLSDGYVFSGPGLTKRINESLLEVMERPAPVGNGWYSYWLFGLFILLGGMLAFLFGVTSIVLPYDEHFLGMKKEEIWLFNERIMLFMAHDRLTLAGTMISGGIVYMQLARYGVKQGLLWAKQAIDAAAIIGFLGIFSFIGYGYFDWLHLLFWLILLPVYAYGFFKTRGLNGTPSSSNLKNDSVWRKGIYGQLAFVLMGFSFVVGGIVISYIGVTSVFVPTDIQYICMPPELLDSFNQNLISVLAHDRAGFGSALLSVGLLVLMLSLWGFQQGNKWVWWTILIGGLPAFITGILIHFLIGYTTFTHLLPAYVAVGLYCIGLLLSYRFLHKKSA
ncbi:dihydroorotate dehydrogenase [Bacillus tianshenii]|uniref:dihydroorotate dehydrogenase n=1 Tax=Sutcliffiella tianshenii TaxID=1463404 RepID=UPI001CD7E1D1|nr:dihydroorotate dehydrogenase [Bacillus tianshenii]MCA1319958.1 dihydroorotate dehydrogenase [Bacillus tianshenii]